jgi:uncharacterized protein (DUF433 family)
MGFEAGASREQDRITKTRPEEPIMAMIATGHIDVDENGVARVAGKRTKVVQIVLDKRANGWGPEEIHAQYPYLSLAEIHAAFAYYYDHQAELDAQIEEDFREAEAMRAQAGVSPLVKKLRAMGKLP